jgi:hypothetical protein
MVLKFKISFNITLLHLFFGKNQRCLLICISDATPLAYEADQIQCRRGDRLPSDSQLSP